MAESEREHIARLAKEYFEQARQNTDELFEFTDRQTSTIVDSIANHFEHYDQILMDHTWEIKDNLVRKRKRKGHFFRFSMFVMSAVLALTILSTVHGLFSHDDNMSQYIVSLTSFLTVFIVLPNTIAKYLFNTEESKQFTEVVNAIAKHDENVLAESKKAREQSDADPSTDTTGAA